VCGHVKILCCKGTEKNASVQILSNFELRILKLEGVERSGEDEKRAAQNVPLVEY
jgi:hypothetical protein